MLAEKRLSKSDQSKMRSEKRNVVRNAHGVVIFAIPEAHVFRTVSFHAYFDLEVCHGVVIFATVEVLFPHLLM